MHIFTRLLLCFILGLTGFAVYAQTYPAGFAQTLVANSITAPTVMAFAPDGRIFVAEQAGKLRVIKNGTLLPTPFITLNVSSTGERGLIGIALDPDFENNQHVYLYYTVPGTPPRNRVSRFTANGDVVEANSEVVILNLDPLSSATNHNGGAMHFGKDGKLYIAVGENATPANAQNLDTYHGKLLRVNKDGSVPEGNPFPEGSEQRKRVWAYGLRNPYTFAVHPETGKIYVNDVGQGTWEEINDATEGGKNFGWPTTEGKFNESTYPAFTNPVYAYQHGSGDGKGCAITGGVFFFPASSNYPESYHNKYFFQDLCNRWINTIDGSAVRASFATNIQQNALSLTLGPDGNLYYLSRTSNALYKIVYNNTTTPYIVSHPAAVNVAEGSAATFSVTALGSAPLSYQWQKDGEDIQGANGSTFIIDSALPEHEGEYGVVVSNNAGTITSTAASLTVIANGRPTASITLPAEGTTYTAGTEISFEGSGHDDEDGELPAANFSWQINFHHDTHKHDEPPVTGVQQGTFFIPTEGETSDNVWYRIILTVTDSRGLEGKDSVDIHPNKSRITIETDPAGLEVLIDGQPFTTPVAFNSVEGVFRSIATNAVQSLDGAEYAFTAWSNTGSSETSQTIQTPQDDLTIVAAFSHIVAVEEEGEDGKPLVYPNPVTSGIINIALPQKGAQVVSVELVNSLSQTVLKKEVLLETHEADFAFAIPDGIKGMHTLLIRNNNGIVVRRLAILR